MCFATSEPLYYRLFLITVESGTPTQGQTPPAEVAGNSPIYSHGCKLPIPVAEGVAGKPSCRASGRILYISYPSQGCRWMTLYGYARI